MNETTTAPAPGGQMEYTFTLTFRNGKVAVVKVNGARSREEAEREASTGFFGCWYEVEEGDLTNGKVLPFRTRAYPEFPRTR